MKILIGTKFIRRNSKRKDVKTVVDILTTTNSKGEVISTKYVAAHDFMGQKVTDSDIAESTILRSEILNKCDNCDSSDNCVDCWKV